MKKTTIIAISIILGVTFGNIAGLIIGSIFFKENLGIGLVLGNSLGVSSGLLVGIIINLINKNKS